VLKNYFWVINLLVVGICSALLGRTTANSVVAALLAGDGPAFPRRDISSGASTEKIRSKDIESILKRNIFCSGCAPISLTPDKAQQDEGPVDQTPQRSGLPLQLISTMVSPGDWDWSMAVIRDTSDDRKRVGIFRRGDKLTQGGAIVAQVVEGRVYMVVGKRVEYITSDKEPPPPPPTAVATAEPSTTDPTGIEKDVEKGVRCTGSSCEVDKSLIDKVLANTTALATSARFVPWIKDGKPSGFKLYNIRTNSIFSKIGIQNADLIKAINGLDMSTPDKALEAYTKLKSASHLTVMVERRGENVTLDYQIR
jgi:general secretion pathway protein C